MTRHRTTRTALAGALVAILAGLTACQPTANGWITPHLEPDRPAYGIVGDSLIAYHPGWPGSSLTQFAAVTMWTTPGAKYQHLPRGWAQAQGRPLDAVVVALGANNAWPLYGADGWNLADELYLHDLIARLLAPGGASCVTISTIAPAPGAHPAWVASASRANAAIRRIAGTSTTDAVALTEWAGAIRNRPELFQPDGLHLTAEGMAKYEQVITAGAVRCAPWEFDTTTTQETTTP
jgi:lysophospholipase L1-like esterase